MNHNINNNIIKIKYRTHNSKTYITYVPIGKSLDCFGVIYCM